MVVDVRYVGVVFAAMVEDVGHDCCGYMCDCHTPVYLLHGGWVRKTRLNLFWRCHT